jgi:hypothetical protein
MKAIQFMVLASALVAGSSVAHHSGAMFDTTRVLTLTGTVSEWHFSNPHSWLYMAVLDAEGKETVWRLEGGSTSHMARNGWTYKSLNKGDKVIVTLNPRTDGTAGGTFKTVQTADGNTLGATPRI